VRVVVALGGNALLKRGEPMTAEVQRANVRVAAEALAELVSDHEIVVAHGNGPQVGLLALQAAAYKDVAPYPLDVLGAESEGMIGYLVEQELMNTLPEGASCATLLTQIEVDPDDPLSQRRPSRLVRFTTRPNVNVSGAATGGRWPRRRPESGAA
jgi:carbamate kinase